MSEGKIYEIRIDLQAVGNYFAPGIKYAWKYPAAISLALIAT
jgi:hypothetical protein